MKRVLVVAVVVASATAFAQDAPATPPATPAPPAPPAAAEPTAPAEVVDPLAEPKKLVEVEANTTANLKKAIALYEAALKDASLDKKVQAAAWTDVSRAYLRLGDLTKGDDAKIALYEKGQAAGKKAESLDSKSAAAIFWATANLACVGRTRGVMNSLFMIGDLKKGMNQALAIDPNFHRARNTLGEIDHAVPGIAGGSDDRAEKAYLEVLRRDAHFTPTMVLLARLYQDKGDEDEAKKWAQKVLDEKSPHPRNDWVKFDKRDAKAILNELK
jgi:tetratricopeptide (TPR) repeat protein